VPAGRILLIGLVALLYTGCARAVEIGSGDAALNYSLEVRNETGSDMIVRYNAGRGDALLGTVANARSERFIIASPAATTITVNAASQAGTRTSGPHTVTLRAGVTVPVTLR
jgi:hypothetical protein